MLLAAVTFPGTGADAGVVACAVVMLVANLDLAAYSNRRSQAPIAR